MGASWAARTLATLGHLEIDWLDRNWAAAPTILTILPDAGAHALLIGSRTRELQVRLTRAVERQDDMWLHEHPQSDARRRSSFKLPVKMLLSDWLES